MKGRLAGNRSNSMSGDHIPARPRSRRHSSLFLTTHSVSRRLSGTVYRMQDQSAAPSKERRFRVTRNLCPRVVGGAGDASETSRPRTCIILLGSSEVSERVRRLLGFVVAVKLVVGRRGKRDGGLRLGAAISGLRHQISFLLHVREVGSF